MKKNLLLLATASALTIFSATAFANNVPNLPHLITMSPQNIFAPPGFDDNDNVQITLAGDLPSTCFKAGPATATVDPVAKTIRIKNENYTYSSCWCLFLNMPYSKTLDLGPVAAGAYDILTEQSDGTLALKGSLTVAHSTSPEPDDYLYALVESATIDEPAPGAPKDLMLKGKIPSGCLKLKTVQVLARVPQIIEVLPIMEQVPAPCNASAVSSFETRLALPKTVTGTSLIHVRSLNGQAVNLVTDL